MSIPAEVEISDQKAYSRQAGNHDFQTPARRSNSLHNGKQLLPPANDFLKTEGQKSAFDDSHDSNIATETLKTKPVKQEKLHTISHPRLSTQIEPALHSRNNIN